MWSTTSFYVAHKAEKILRLSLLSFLELQWLLLNLYTKVNDGLCLGFFRS